VAKSTVICVKFFPDVARQKLLKSVNAAWSYSKNKSGTFFMDTGVILYKQYRTTNRQMCCAICAEQATIQFCQQSVCAVKCKKIAALPAANHP